MKCCSCYKERSLRAEAASILRKRRKGKKKEFMVAPSEPIKSGLALVVGRNYCALASVCSLDWCISRRPCKGRLRGSMLVQCIQYKRHFYIMEQLWNIIYVIYRIEVDEHRVCLHGRCKIFKLSAIYIGCRRIFK